MKKAFSIFILLFFSFRIFAATTALPEYVPYEHDEFRPWMHKLRRAEVITLGATALTYPVVGWVSKYDDTTMSGFWKKFAWAAGAGVLIALADFIIGEVQEKNERNAADRKAYTEIAPDSEKARQLDAMQQQIEQLKEQAAEQSENKPEQLAGTQNAQNETGN